MSTTRQSQEMAPGYDAKGKPTRKPSTVHPTDHPVTLAVDGQVRDGGMYLRTVHASGEVERDGETWEIEFAVTMKGSMLVTLKREDADQWTTYSVSPEGMMRAVCAAHFAEPAHA